MRDKHEESAIAVDGLVKSYGGVRALRGVSLSVRAGEVLGLLGDNGAGKSTLVRCVAGVERPDEGEIRISGAPVDFGGAADATRAGVETVYQDLALFKPLDAATNLFLNREIVRPGVLGRIGWLDKKRMRSETASVLDGLGIRLPSPKEPVGLLSGGQRQAVAVGRAVAWGRKVVVLDEPTAALGVEQSRLILDLVKRLRASGVAVLLVSHNMYDVLEVCDRVVALRHGSVAGRIDDLTGLGPRDLVDLIMGVPSTGDASTDVHRGED